MPTPSDPGVERRPRSDGTPASTTAAADAVPVASSEPGPNRLLTWAVLAAIVGYVVAVVAFALAGWHAFIFKTTLVPLLLVVALVGNRVKTFIQDWIVFLSVVVLFDALRGFTFASAVVLGRAAFIQYPIRWELLLFGTPALGLPLQAWSRAHPLAWLTPLCIVLHASHFAFFLLFGLIVWAVNRREFGRWVLVMMITMGVGLACYAAVPTMPPWLASRQRFIPPLVHLASMVYNAALPTIRTVLDTNPVAAMPSLHAAFPAVCALTAFRVWGRKGAALWLYVAGMAFALTYLGEHYAVDVLAGVILAVGVHFFVGSWTALGRWAEQLGWCRWPAMRHFTVAMILVLIAVLISSWTAALVPALQQL